MFHALTGCNTVSNFAGHRKKTIWAVELKGIFALFVLRSAVSAFDFDHEQTNIRYMYRNEASKRNIAQLTMIFVKQHNKSLKFREIYLVYLCFYDNFHAVVPTTAFGYFGEINGQS